MMHKVTDLQPWECLMKRIVWKQLGEIRDKKILDFGSGIGVTANYLAEHNDVTAIEPDEDSINERWADNQYTQIVGSTDELHKFDNETFDMIICHNVLEYAEDRADIVKEFARILKPNGKISIVKHNRAGRVMQMVVLLNDFEHAHSLLDGNDGMASKYGAIRYYEDAESIAMVQNRNIEALNEILSDNTDKEIVIGTHGTALSTILNFYDNSFGCEDFLRIIDWMPYIIELDFEGDKLVGKQEHCHVEKEFKGKQRADKK